MAAYRRVYDSRHLQADCQEPGSAPEPYTRLSSMGYLYLFYNGVNVYELMLCSHSINLVKIFHKNQLYLRRTSNSSRFPVFLELPGLTCKYLQVTKPSHHNIPCGPGHTQGGCSDALRNLGNIMEFNHNIYAANTHLT